MSVTTRTKPLLRVLSQQRVSPPPIWLMRQAGRYLPEYREVRAAAGSFLNLCYNPERAAEVTLQPLRRFDLDAAIIFSDILVIPHALGQELTFVEGEGPQLPPLQELPEMEERAFLQQLDPVYEALKRVSETLSDDAALIGFAGAPWTLACYMLDGRGGRGFPRALQVMRQRATWFGQLIDRLVEAIVLHLSKQIQAGAEVVQLFDSWAGLLTHEEARLWSLAPMLRVTGELARLHPGVPVILFPRKVDQESLLALAEDGRAAGLSLDQEQDLGWAAEALQTRIALQGNLSPDALLEGGARLEREAGGLLDALKQGPHIVNLGHGVMQPTPPEHVAALVKQVRRFN